MDTISLKNTRFRCIIFNLKKKPMQTFTHLEFLELEQNEKSFKESLDKMEDNDERYSPKKQTINNILNYSKSLSIKKSKHVDFIEMILN